jgi:hypothetical protein
MLIPIFTKHKNTLSYIILSKIEIHKYKVN